MWVPSLGSPCGIAEYATFLSQHLPDLRMVTRAADAVSAKLLHVQHEHKLFDADELQASLAQHRLHGPVVITEHTITEQREPWEAEADALVALTRRGTEMLRRKWPDKRIARIPHGCPTWFPSRKPFPGRVIGAFGFLKPHKGFWKLLDVLRALPNTELLIYSYARSRADEAGWTEAAAGLPVRRITAYVGAEEIVAGLAREADILVYWYDDYPEAAVTSGAVRIGLASGVPVLTSPTTWFSELREVTYQPKNMTEGIAHLLEDSALRHDLSAAAAAYCWAHRWEIIAAQYATLWSSLH